MVSALLLRTVLTDSPQTMFCALINLRSHKGHVGELVKGKQGLNEWGSVLIVGTSLFPYMGPSVFEEGPFFVGKGNQIDKWKPTSFQPNHEFTGHLSQPFA